MDPRVPNLDYSLFQMDPDEFKEYMHYCRGLAFTQDPDYGYIISLFEGCMKRHGFDTRTADFVWNKNRLALEKEAIKR